MQKVNVNSIHQQDNFKPDKYPVKYKNAKKLNGQVRNLSTIFKSKADPAFTYC